MGFGGGGSSSKMDGDPVQAEKKRQQRYDETPGLKGRVGFEDTPSSGSALLAADKKNERQLIG